MITHSSFQTTIGSPRTLVISNLAVAIYRPRDLQHIRVSILGSFVLKPHKGSIPYRVMYATFVDHDHM